MDLAGKSKKYLIKFLKVLAWVVLSVMLLLVAISLAIQIPAIQNKIVQKAVAFLKEKIHTEVRLRHVSLSFPKRVELEGLYVEDQANDTLLYIGNLGVDTDLWALTDKTIELNQVQFDTLVATLKRPAQDSTFNFDYIIQAFAGDTTDTTPEDTTSTPWQFAVESVGLTQTRVAYLDTYNGNELYASVGELEVSTNDFDLNTMTIHVDNVKLSNADVSFTLLRKQAVRTSTSIAEPADTTATALPDLDVKSIDLHDIRFAFNDYNTRQVINADVAEASIEADAFDLNRQRIALNNVSLERAFASYHQMVTSDIGVISSEEADTTTTAPWYITSGKIDLKDVAFQYYDFNRPAQEGAIDYSRLWLSQLNLEAEDVRYNGTEDMAATIYALTVSEKSGIAITSFEGGLLLTKNTLAVRDLDVHTRYSAIQLNAEAQFDDFANLARSYPDASIKLDMSPSTISLRDVKQFSPGIFDGLSIKLPANAAVTVEAMADGKIRDLNLSHLRVKTLDSTTVDLHGTIKGLPDAEKSVLDMKLDKLHTTRHDMTTVLSDSILPRSIAVPSWIDLEGKVKGSIRAPVVHALLTTQLGKLQADATLNFDSTARQNYDGKISLQQFQLGRLLRQDSTMGALNLDAAIKGRGFDIKDIDAALNLIVHDFEYNHYTYRDFKVDGTLRHYFFTGTAALSDKNLDIKLKGDLDYQGDVPHYKFTLSLLNADFKALHLSERALRMRGTLDVNLATTDFKVINGNIDIRKVAIFNGEKLYAVDSLLFVSIDQDGQSEINVHSDLLAGQFKGNINIAGLPEALRRHFDHYFSLKDPTFKKPVAPQNFNFHLEIKNTELLTEIILPDLEPFVPGEIAGEFNSAEDRLNLRMNIAQIKYAGVSLDSMWMKVISNKESLDYTLSLDKIKVDTMRIEQLKLSGNVMHDSIYTIFTILDSLKKEKYVLGGVFNSYEDAFQFRFLPRLLKLDYERWTTPMYNTLRFTDKGLSPNDFYISKGNERILLVKHENQDSTLTLAFRDVALKNVTSIIEGVTPLDGVIDGDLTMGVARGGSFNSELNIKSLVVLGQAWGDLALKLQKTATSPTNIDLKIQGKHLDVTSKGSLSSNTGESNIKLNTVLSKVDLAVIEPLARTQVTGLKGLLKGKVDIEGNTSSPAINGELIFDHAEFTPVLVGSKFTLQDERITLTGSGITLRNFTIRDAAGNTARVSGTAKARNKTYGSFDLALTLDAENFQIMKTTDEDNELFYGDVRINTKARINGNSDFPKIEVNASLSKGSTFTYVVPEVEKSILEQEGIVRFVDRDAVKDPFLKDLNPKDTIKSRFTGIDLTANIELTDQATFNVVIDPIAGDQLSVKGNSTLALTIDETGDMQLSGRYEISEGSYSLSFYKLVKRQFAIVKGSSISWTGDVLMPELDIRASYTVETSPIDLMSNEGDYAQLRQRVPFIVYLILKGNLLTPDISFELDMPEDKQSMLAGRVYAKIKDINTRESDLNKQVFALLVLKRFISENPLDSQSGGDVATTARTSVSRILSDQLNRLSENVKGLQLTFDVKSYEQYNASGGSEGQTQLQLGVQKSLLDDRLVVKVSGNLSVEGDQDQQQRSYGDYIGDLALEYKLTKDGRLRVTGFRNSNYDMIDGDLIETGTGVIYIKDYDTFRELFRSNDKPN